MSEETKSVRLDRVSPMGVALRELAGGAGKSCSEKVEVTLRTADFNVVSMRDPKTGAEQSMPAHTLVSFGATSFRELVRADRPTDVWEFRVEAPDGRPALLFLAGKDILNLRVASRVL